MPSRLRPIRISAVAVLVTAAAVSDWLRMTIKDGGGNIAARFTVPQLPGVGQDLQTMGVNAAGGIEMAIGAATPRVAFLPPDLVVEVGDAVEFDFFTPPTSVDSPIVVSYEEAEEE